MLNFRQYPSMTKCTIPNKVILTNNGDISSCFYNMRNLVSVDFNHEDVTSMYMTYYGCYNLTGSPVCGNNVIDMTYAYNSCYNLTGNPVCGDNVTNMCYAYNGCYNLTGSPVCGNNVTSMSMTYSSCTNLTGSPVCGDKVTDMYYAYNNCTNLTGSPVCGNNVINMMQTYYNCINLTGNPVCGNNVTDMYRTYYNCRNLTGSPVCGSNVTSMMNTYYNCTNLTGNPVCGNNVTRMSQTYYNCFNLTGSPVCGSNVTNMYGAYYCCYNLSASTVTWYSNNISNATNCFYRKNNARQYTIKAYPNTTTWNTLKTNNTSSIVGASITWTNYSNGGFYNTAYNIYVLPILNTFNFSIDGITYQAEENMTWSEWVDSKYNTIELTISDDSVISADGSKQISVSPTDVIEPGYAYTLEARFNPAEILQDFNYTDNGDGTYTLTGWKGTTNGVPGQDIIIPETGGKVILE